MKICAYCNKSTNRFIGVPVRFDTKKIKFVVTHDTLCSFRCAYEFVMLQNHILKAESLELLQIYFQYYTGKPISISQNIAFNTTLEESMLDALSDYTKLSQQFLEVDSVLHQESISENTFVKALYQPKRMGPNEKRKSTCKRQKLQ